jgi:small-conductance mechanosensitive channel
MHTQLGILRRILIFVISVIALSSMLMTLDNVRQIGVSLLASAGVIGIIAGFAAQRSIATLFAGIQVALTQPIRLDDVVIVEGEWGRIEEITLTYVVVRIWDQRRLIVPITYFMEQSFQNWTRVSSDILGTVFLYVDYTMPVDGGAGNCIGFWRRVRAGTGGVGHCRSRTPRSAPWNCAP